ncbi:hypothetical protein VaNZ11_007205 [Volvox africanus]|uniref:Structural maintenance of chromosomes protein 5 n=1 Tax=Volvox africanus TaxID=51714 RepID=A0ABQ5S368_9CHLO|nr:hypothetical protein VaNZ11_007205 [Volvox africanus]
MRGIKRERSDDGELRESGCESYDPGNVEEDKELASAEGDDAGSSPALFAKGSVKLVKVHDFMTYNGTVVIRPGPRLNLVLGPNGTGKSSLVCALCLGLNGSPKTLGRADDIKAFVRRGAHSFWTEITLSSGCEERDHVVKRTVTVRTERDANGERRERFESKWKINGVDTTSKDVDKLIRQLKIQFDNLCQFLPQDKVAEFAKMDQYELLGATLKAVGDASMHEQHQLLIRLRKEEKQQIADLATATSRMQKLEAEQERQRRDFERFQQREKLLAEARALLCQAKWLEVVAKGKAAESAKQRLLSKREALKALEDQQEEQTRPIREREEAVKELRQRKIAAEREARDADARMRRTGDELNKRDNDMTVLADELTSLDQQGKERAAQITVAQQKVERAKAELAQAPQRPPQELYDRINELRGLTQSSARESSEIEANQNDLTLHIQALQEQIGRVRGRLDMLNSRKHQMLQRLGKHHRNIGQLHSFVEQHRTDGTFQGPVFGPVALELSVKAARGVPSHVALQYVENACWSLLASYIVTNIHDESTLIEEAKRLGVASSVKIICSDYDPNQPYVMQHPAGPACHHARYGIIHTLDELIEAAPIFVDLLTKMCKTNLCYIGTSETIGLMETLVQETPINTVIVGASHMSVVRSLYNDNVRSIDFGELYPAKLLGAGGGSEEDGEKAKLQEEGDTLIQECDELQAKAEQLVQQLQQKEQERKRWQAEVINLHAQQQAIVEKRTALIAAVKIAERQLCAKEALPDPEQRRPVLRCAIEDTIAEIAALTRGVLTAAQDLWAVHRNLEVLELRLSEAGAQLSALRAIRDQHEKDLQAARTVVITAEDAFKSAQNEFRRAKDNAAEHFPLSDSDKEELRRHEAEKTQPSTLRSLAEEKSVQAEQVVCNNQNVVNEFSKRQAEIAHLGESVKQHEERCQELRTRIDEVQGVWLPGLRKMVSAINASFSNNFKEIGCAGEVRLHEDEDFEKFAIQILVQFRAHEDMQLLTGTRQSGGERSVSTILYLIALQGITETPFRVVDEINQGMDPLNERKVYKQLVAASTEEHTPQCFLLTPKLLPGLAYTRDIHTLIIYSSSEMEEGLPATFTTDDICG